jgi:hypothetical protein
MITLIGFSLDEARTDIKRYVDAALEKGIPNRNVMRAYLVNATDAMAVLGIDPSTQTAYSHFRAYIGMDADSAYKLFMVPVNADNVDVIPEGPDRYYPHQGQYVFDFNTPCPNSCDLTSPLFVLK